MTDGQDSPDAHDPAVTALAPAPVAPEPAAPPPLTAVQLALYAGWTMAVLYGTIQTLPEGVPELPTAHELPPPQRREVELSRLCHLLQHLSYPPEITQPVQAAAIAANYADANALKAPLENLNLAILEALTAAPPEIELAYELGRSLRDTVNPPLQYATPQGSPAPALERQLARERVSKLQQWLATLSAQFPQHATAVVATSLGRWSELAAVTVSTTGTRFRKGDRHAVASAMCEYLLPQGDIWLMLLTGARSASGLLSPEGYVAAGEVALRRSAAIVRQVLRHYWVALLVVAAAMAGILYLIVSTLSGAAEAWTTIATVTGSLGISANAITSATARLSAEAERPVFAMSEEDAMAWAITAMPAVDLRYRGVRQLRKAGVAPPKSLGRI